MRPTLLISFLICVFYNTSSPGQGAQPISAPKYTTSDTTSAPPDSVPGNIARIGQSVEAMNRNLEKFFSNFSTNQGLKLSDKQQRLLFALEVLTRTETSLANAQRQRLDFVERISRLRLQLAQVKDNLLPQSLDRYVSLRGTTDAVELRESRRIALEKERLDLTNTVNQLQFDIDRLNEDIKRAQLQIDAIRNRLFGEVEKELADL